MDIVDAQIHVGRGGIGATLAAMDALGIASVIIDEFWHTRKGITRRISTPAICCPTVRGARRGPRRRRRHSHIRAVSGFWCGWTGWTRSLRA